MVNPALLFLALLAFLFFLSTLLSKWLGILIYRLTSDRDLTSVILAVIFLPGTVVHEFAHAAVAHGFGLYVGEIRLLPEISENRVKLGSVQVQESDPFRRFFVGVAPIIVGLLLILITLRLYEFFAGDASWFFSAIVYYILFQIGNGMFSSRRDMEGAIELGAALLLVFGVLYFLGVRFSASGVLTFLNSQFAGVFEVGTRAISQIIVVDLVIVIFAWGLHFLLKSRVRHV